PVASRRRPDAPRLTPERGPDRRRGGTRHNYHVPGMTSGRQRFTVFAPRLARPDRPTAPASGRASSSRTPHAGRRDAAASRLLAAAAVVIVVKPVRIGARHVVHDARSRPVRAIA